MASLPLALIEPPQIKDRSRQQIVCGGICGREFFRALYCGYSFGELPIDKKPNPAQGRARLRQIRCDGDGLFRIAARIWTTRARVDR